MKCKWRFLSQKSLQKMKFFPSDVFNGRCTYLAHFAGSGELKLLGQKLNALNLTVQMYYDIDSVGYLYIVKWLIIKILFRAFSFLIF